MAKLVKKERDTSPPPLPPPQQSFGFALCRPRWGTKRGLSPSLCRVGFRDAQLLGVGVVLTSSEPSVRAPGAI